MGLPFRARMRIASLVGRLNSPQLPFLVPPVASEELQALFTRWDMKDAWYINKKPNK